MQAEINQLRSDFDGRLDILENKATSLMNNLTELYDYIDVRTNTLKNNITELTHDLSQLRGDFDKLGLDELKTRVTALETRLDSISDDFDEMKTDIEDLGKEVFKDIIVISPSESLKRVKVGEPSRLDFCITFTGDVSSSIQNLTFTAFIRNGNALIFAPLSFDKIAEYKVFNNTDELIQNGTVKGLLSFEKYAGYPWWQGVQQYWSVTWRIPGYLEGNNRQPEINKARIVLSFYVHGVSTGETSLKFFMRGTTDCPDVGVQNLEDIHDQTSIIKHDGLWYPAPGSYEPYDMFYDNGHTWQIPYTWEPITTVSEYPKSIVAFVITDP